MKAVRVVELAQVMDSISPKDLATAKEIRLNVGIVNDLQEAVKELATKVEEFTVRRNELLKPFQEQFKERSVGMDTEAEKDVLSNSLDKEFNTKHKKELEKNQEEIKVLGEVEVEFELGDEKMEKLKECMEKYGATKYQNKKVFIEVCDALGIE